MSTAAQELPETHSEVVAMALLSELQPAIAVALDSLGGKMTKVVEDLYYLYASSTSTPLLMPSSFCVGSTASMVRACWCAPQSKLCYASKRFALKHTSFIECFFAKPLKPTNGSAA